jgi:hypothetical protein
MGSGVGLFSREFKVEAVRLVMDRRVSMAQAGCDLRLMADNGVVCSMSRSGNV